MTQKMLGSYASGHFFYMLSCIETHGWENSKIEAGK